MDYDYIIVGSGFGGSVSALRLAEKGWNVCVLEQGDEITPSRIKAAKDTPRKLYWLPKVGLRGFFGFDLFKHVSVLKGVGLGGGSLVWGGVMLEPKNSFYEDPNLARTGVNWKQELPPYLEKAKAMFGVTLNPNKTEMDEYLEQTAKAMQVGETYGPVPNAIYFGTPNTLAKDPYFNGRGPSRRGCDFCGGCMTGCEKGAKNSLDYNYIHLAKRLGVKFLCGRKVLKIKPLEKGFKVEMQLADGKFRALTARNLVLSAGVVGTLKLLFNARDIHKTLPKISTTLGNQVRTNSEAITAILHPKNTDLTEGTGISSDFYPDANTHITQNRFVKNFSTMRFMFGPLVSEPNKLKRKLKTLAALAMQSGLLASNYFARQWEKRVTILTVMQDCNEALRIKPKRHWWWPFATILTTEPSKVDPLPGYIAAANQATQAYAKVAGGKPMNNLAETLLGTSVTAHILSGCPMGQNDNESVIDSHHQVHNYPGLYVVDGSSIPANIGVNPSLTIAAMAERFADLQPVNHKFTSTANAETTVDTPV